MKHEHYEVIHYRGKTIEIDIDEDVESPRIDRDNVGTMVCFHRRYDLGDKHEFKEPEDFKKWWQENGEGGVLMSLYLFDHSGLSISTGAFSCPWDSGQVGWIYCTAKTIEHEWGRYPDAEKTPIERATSYLKAEVEEYDKYLRGEIYCYQVDDDSCCGFYDLEECIAEAKATVEHQVEKEELKRQQKLKALIKGHAPIDIREKILTER
jgi:hypothetical protein